MRYASTAPAGRTLVGGNWATTAPYVVNPGYFSPRAEWELFEASADRRWTDITRTQRVLGWQLIGTGMLPPDWATVSEVGHAVPTGPVTGGPIRFGLDAARPPVRFAESCDREDRALAGAMRPILTAPGEVPALRNLNGSAASNWQHPVALVAAAAGGATGAAVSDLLRRRLGGAGPHHADHVAARRMPGGRLSVSITAIVTDRDPARYRWDGKLNDSRR